MAQSKNAYMREYRDINVRTTDGATISGKINIGTKERVSELFTKTDSPFIVLTDAAYGEVMGKVLFINKNNIIWVEPVDFTSVEQEELEP